MAGIGAQIKRSTFDLLLVRGNRGRSFSIGGQMIAKRLVIGVLGLACVLGAAGCARQGAFPSAQALDSIGTPAAESNPRWMNWASSMPGVSLDEARDKVGVPIHLPGEAAAGAIRKVVLDDTGSFEAGKPGLLFLFGSGVTLSIQHRAYDLDDLGSVSVPFTDGRTSMFEARTVDGGRVLAGEAGTQIASHGDNKVPSQVMWNDGGIGYRLTGPTDDFGVDRLIEVMRSFR